MIQYRFKHIFPVLAGIVLFATSCSTQHQTQSSVPKEQRDFAVAAAKQNDSVNIARNFIDGCKEKELGDLDGAIVFFKEVLNSDPSNDAAMYELANIYFKLGRNDDARELAAAAAAKNPGNEYYQDLYSNILLYSGDYDGAAKAYEKIISMDPDMENYLQLVGIYEKAGKYDDALNVLQRMQKNFGDDENILNEEQMLYVKTGQMDKAIQTLHLLIGTDPGEPSYYDMLARIYEMTHQGQAADSVYDQLFILDPDNADLLFKKADKEEKSGDVRSYFATMRKTFADPNADIDKKIFFLIPYVDSLDNKNFTIRDSVMTWTQLLVQAHPSDAKAYATRGDFLYYNKQLSEARKNYRQSITIKSDIYDVWTKLFYIDADMSQNDSLKAVTDEAIELFPNQPLAYYFNGVALNRMMQYDNAVRSLSHALPLSSNNMSLRADIFSALGDAYNELKQYDASDKSFESSLQINPDNSYALNNYAYYLSLRGENLDKAETMAKKANDLEPNDASLLDTYAWVLFKEGKYADAKTTQEKALQNNGDKSGVIVEHYGDILFKLGDIDGAVEQWKKAKSLSGASDLIDKKINDRMYYE